MDSLLEQFQDHIVEAKLKPSTGGRFEVSVDGSLVYSKLESGDFPETATLLEVVGPKVAAES